MAAEEDKQFDAVLGGFLVNDVRARAERLHCPEPDVLAAYHERSLLPEEMNAWKEHIVGCSHCQAILGELEATDSIPLVAPEKEEVLVMEPAESVAVGSEERRATRETTTEKLRARPTLGVAWKWLAPAGALAAGLLVWVAWHENQRPPFSVISNDKMAKVEPSSPPPAEVTRQSPAASSPNQSASLSKDSALAGDLAREKKLPTKENFKQTAKFDSIARGVAPKPPAKTPAGERQDTERDQKAADSLTAANRPENHPNVSAKGVVGAASGSAEVQTQAANVQTQNERSLQNQSNQSNTQRMHGPNTPSQAAQSKKEKSAASDYAYRAGPPAAAPPNAPAAFSDVSTSSGLIAGSSNWHLIAAPGAKTLWRAGPAGLITFSSDGGASWVRQTSNVFVELTAGSAPSDKVCWIVGRAGTILLTIDSGAHWTILHSLLAEELGGVRAPDALHATIWNAGGTKAFETSDGGVTWKPVPPPQ